MIEFNCSHCGQGITVKDDAAGKRGKCRKCGLPVQVPDVVAESAPVAEAAPPVVTSNQQLHVQPPPHYQAQPATAIQVNVEQPSRAAHSLGISSLVVGIFSFFVCWLPIVAFPLAGLGLLLGVVGLVTAFARKGSGIGYSIAGSAINCLGLLLGFIFISFIAESFRAVDEAMNEFAKETTPIQARPPQGTPPTSNDDNTQADPLPTEPAWTDSNSPLELGSVQIRITEVTIGKVPLTGILGDDTTSKDDLLTIWVEVTNTSERKKIDYRGWMERFASAFDASAELTDDAANRYRKVTFGSSSEIRGAQSNESIYPGKSVRDAIVFELPIENLEYLRLKLPAKPCDEEGEFRFEIPKAMIQHQ